MVVWVRRRGTILCDSLNFPGGRMSATQHSERAMTTTEYKPLTDAYKKVLKKEKFKAFYIHLLAYFVVNIVLFVTNIESNPAVFWGCFLGWGSGVIAILITKILPMDKQLEAQRIEVEALAAQSR